MRLIMIHQVKRVGSRSCMYIYIPIALGHHLAVRFVCLESELRDAANDHCHGTIGPEVIMI